MPQETNYMKYWPLVVFGLGIAAAQGRNEFSMQSMAQDIQDNAETIEENEELLKKLRENDIRTEGQLKLEVQQLNSNIALQSSKIDQLLQILKDDR